ncbi:hypothetical protein LPC08_25400 (plasmid) [Roseomonas sp. OT10]|uniref:MAE_28990/MAE_18760 family HEPN-like nuclease n=1 Tax=Roseomonas cutis TaxID=2897332 RepID=UPI001E61341F|nr:MAE_28990/MAE_18760 family HEPN-like nuclease [Roseomonas sp. OT10]UFN51603.1 hypothetical protein LPC08_25400 [Roseomonas sp. OT10]
MEALRTAFEERLQEIDAHLELLDSIEAQIGAGKPRSGPKVSPQQQKILYSTVFLLLYSLVEATATQCVEAVCTAVDGKGWRPHDLSDRVRLEWVRSIARTHEDLVYDRRLTSALEMFEMLVAGSPVAGFKVSGGGGNWDDDRIEKMLKRLGLQARLTEETKRGVKRHFHEGMGTLEFIRHRRNKLAHGNLSFVECAGTFTVSELRKLKEGTAAYLREVVESFATAIAGHEYLRPERRPARAGA